MKYLSMTLFLLAIGFAGFEPPADSNAKIDHESIHAYGGAVVFLRNKESGRTYYIESSGTRLVAIDDKKGLLWIFDATKGMSKGDLEQVLGKPVIRHLRLRDDTVIATFGKKTNHHLNAESGDVLFSETY